MIRTPMKARPSDMRMKPSTEAPPDNIVTMQQRFVYTSGRKNKERSTGVEQNPGPIHGEKEKERVWASGGQ